jgi:hypothetical protein
MVVVWVVRFPSQNPLAELASQAQFKVPFALGLAWHRRLADTRFNQTETLEQTPARSLNNGSTQDAVMGHAYLLLRRVGHGRIQAYE